MRNAAVLALLISAGAFPAHAAKSLMPPPPRSAAVEDDTKWEAENLDVGSWLRLSIGTESMRYMTASGIERQPGRDLRVWVRGEQYVPFTYGNQPVRSLLTLTEYDCDQKRFRELATDAYPYNNLQGPKRSQDDQSPQWQYPRPDTVGAVEISSICKMMDEVDAQNAHDAASAAALPQGDATWKTVEPVKPK